MSQFHDVMRSLEPLLRQHKTLKKMEFGMMCDWIAYYWNRETIAYLLDDTGKARAVCLVKLFRQLKQFLEPFVHDPCGKFCMVELMVANDAEAMGIVHDQLVSRWGAQEFVLWDRGERTESGSPRIWRWDQFEDLAERIRREPAMNSGD